MDDERMKEMRDIGLIILMRFSYIDYQIHP